LDFILKTYGQARALNNDVLLKKEMKLNFLDGAIPPCRVGLWVCEGGRGM